MRYYFHFLGGDDRLDDDLGIEHATAGDARREAVRAAREIMAESLRRNVSVPDDSVIEITDHVGRLVDQIPLVDAAFGESRDRRHRRVFDALPQGSLLLSTDFVVIDANAAFLRARQVKFADVAGRWLFDAFPDNPGLPGADGVRNLTASLEIVLRDKVAHELPLQRHDVRRRDGRWDERYWKLLNIPVLDACGAVEFIVQQAEDVTLAILGERSRAG